MVAALCLPATAEAWIQYQTSQGEPMRWSPGVLSQAIPWTVGETDLAAAGLTTQRLAQATQRAFAAWQQGPCDPCLDAPASDGCKRDCAVRPTELALRYLGPRPSGDFGLTCTERADDGHCVDAQPNGNQVLVIDDQGHWPYGSNVIAMTLISALPDDGWIADADIALNTAWYDFCSADCQAMQPVLEDTLLHEAGHFFGLDHSAHKPAAMWVHADVLGEAGLTLHEDDLDGICAIYGGPAPACEPTPASPFDEGGCSATKGQGHGAAPFAVALLCVLGLCWRRSAGRAGRPQGRYRGLGGVS